MRLSYRETYRLAQSAVQKLRSRWPDVPPEMWTRFLVALADHESDRRTDAKNPKSSATGITQIVKGTRAWLEDRLNLPKRDQSALTDPAYAMLLSAEYVAWLYTTKAGRSWDKTAIAYYAGHVTDRPDARTYLHGVRTHYWYVPWTTVS